MLLVGLALGLGATTMGCGPQKKFCPDSGDGVCPDAVDAALMDKHVDAPTDDMGSIYVGKDAGAK